MAAQNPVIIGTDTLEADKWIKIATAVSNGFYHILKGDVPYYQTYRLTGGAAPDDLILPDDDLFEGVPVYYRNNERIAGKSLVIGGDGISCAAPSDIYLYCEGGPGRIRLDIGE